MYTVLTIDRTVDGILRTHYSVHSTIAKALDRAVDDALRAFGADLVVIVKGDRESGYYIHVAQRGMESARYVSIMSDGMGVWEDCVIETMLEAGVYDALPVLSESVA